MRVWVPGCATGEEPYSIAMLFLEQFAVAKKPVNLQIFATDIDDDSLETARQGVYPESIAADVPPARLTRFFVKTDENHFQVSKQLRESLSSRRKTWSATLRSPSSTSSVAATC